MNLLLDTHVWLWSHLEPQRLSARARDALSTPEDTVALSPVSVWETLLLAEKGPGRARSRPMEVIRSALATRPMREFPLTHEVALRSRSIRLPHDDPADRFIAATAMVHGLTLVTADRTLLECPDIAVLPAGDRRADPGLDWSCSCSIVCSYTSHGA